MVNGLICHIEKVDRQRLLFCPGNNQFLPKHEQMIVDQVANFAREIEEADHVVCVELCVIEDFFGQVGIV